MDIVAKVANYTSTIFAIADFVAIIIAVTAVYIAVTRDLDIIFTFFIIASSVGASSPTTPITAAGASRFGGGFSDGFASLGLLELRDAGGEGGRNDPRPLSRVLYAIKG